MHIVTGNEKLYGEIYSKNLFFQIVFAFIDLL